MRIYDLFISHAWSYSERYNGIVRLLNSDTSFRWRDYSASSHDPLVDPEEPVRKRKLQALIKEQIRQCSCFIVVAGMFVYYRSWIQFEINVAQKYGKPIIGVRRRGAQVTPAQVEEVADEMVNWNSASLIAAIERVCTGRGKALAR